MEENTNCHGECCGDNRFEIIEKAKKRLIDSTNIETHVDEMKVLDNFLFKCWQMGWLDCYDDREYSVVDDVRIVAIGYWGKGWSEEQRAIFIQTAMEGARWLYRNNGEYIHQIEEEKSKRWPIPEGGRTYEDALLCSAFECGVYWAYDDMFKKNLLKKC